MLSSGQMDLPHFSPETIIERSLASGSRGACILDSCGVGSPGANRLIAGVEPVEILRVGLSNAESGLRELQRWLGRDDRATVFTLSYEFGRYLQAPDPTPRPFTDEPAIFAAAFDGVLLHDYESRVTRAVGSAAGRIGIKTVLERQDAARCLSQIRPLSFGSSLSRRQYVASVLRIQELIREGETYQTNLTQQIKVELAGQSSAPEIFGRLRATHPAPFSAYLDRGDSKVVSASPELFVRLGIDRDGGKTIEAAPIKGTRRRGVTPEEDSLLRSELRESVKDRAENTMIVDLMRNDLGRVCEFGTVAVEDLCRIEGHPTLFHLVSEISGRLRFGTSYSDIIRATFPSGSITGAPKLRTMQIIDKLEPVPRGLSMGAIGCRLPARFAGDELFEMSVAIRTMVQRGRAATFNVGGGIVIDSDPEAEYEESMLKAKALLAALGVPPMGFEKS